MTVMVLVAHVWMTYGAAGSWFYRETSRSRASFSVLGTLYTLTVQAFLMGFFFLLAGYFTPASYDRKGLAKFLYDRCLRLGIPLLIFGLLLAPVTVALAALPLGQPFWASFASVWRSMEFINGPMWFAQALLIFSFGYCLWQLASARFVPRDSNSVQATPVPSSWMWLLWALAVGMVAFLLRIWAPVDQRIFGLWLGYFPSFIFLFGIGVLAWRHDWLNRLTWKQAWLWLIISIAVWPTLPAAYARMVSHHHRPNLNGGFTVQAAMYAFWEPFVAWGLIATGLVWFRNSFNHTSRLQDWLSRRAYAVYVIHPPVLVALCVLARSWHVSVPVKFVCLSVAGCAATWLAADPLVRLPGLRRIF